MFLRILGAGLALVVALPLAWRLLQSPEVRRWWTPSPVAGKPFQFDNGTVREPPVPASGATAEVNQGLKKCRRGDTVVYTDGHCPPGAAVVPIGGTVNVVKSTAAPAAKIAAPAASDAKRLPNVRDVLDVSRQPTLYDQHMERVTKR